MLNARCSLHAYHISAAGIILFKTKPFGLFGLDRSVRSKNCLLTHSLFQPTHHLHHQHHRYHSHRQNDVIKTNIWAGHFILPVLLLLFFFLRKWQSYSNAVALYLFQHLIIKTNNITPVNNMSKNDYFSLL